MKKYDTIETYGKHWNIPIIAFDKLDGSNSRFEFSHKKGFWKAGTRRDMIHKNSPYDFAIDIFLEKYGQGLWDIFHEKEYRNVRSIVCFAELIGTRSAFGQHDFGNDEFDVVLFDVDRHNKGLIPPRQFIKDFGHLGIPDVVYEGELNEEFVEQVKRNKFGLTEGVICKGMAPNKKGKMELYYCKIKTHDWLQRLKEKDADQYEQEIKEMKVDISREV